MTRAKQLYLWNKILIKVKLNLISKFVANWLSLETTDLCDRAVSRSFDRDNLMNMKQIFEVANEDNLFDLAITGADIISQV